MTPQLLETGALSVVALVLTGAALTKRRSRPLLAAAESILAGALVVAPGAVSAAAAGVVFAGFAAVHLRRRSEGGGCDCLGEARSGSPWIQAVMTALTAATLATIAADPAPRSPLGVLLHSPGPAALTWLAAALAAVGWRVAFTFSPAGLARTSDRLVNSSARFLEQRTTRRTALIRLATVGSALAVAPVRYLLYPGSALAAILVPSDCSSGLCTDGYTAFCCEINRGENTCPTGTFAGGWWKCTDYPGRRLCAEEGVRYYIDCNRIPGRAFPGGCHCAEDSCEHRRVNCNVFRYGQCNPQVQGVTEVVCRMVVCENPSRIPSMNCNASLAVDDAVCLHDVPCLQPAIPVGSAGGV